MINKTLSERVFEKIKDDILTGDLKPGDRLFYEKIAEKLNVSLTPVKEALLLLEQEGLVKIVPRKGAYVTKLTDRDIIEYTQIRLAIESLAAELVCETPLPKEAFEPLRELNKEMEKAAQNNDIQGGIRLDIKFHKTLVTLSKNKRLLGIVERMPLVNFFAHVGTQKIMFERRYAILIEHEKLINALEACNVETAKEILRQNVRSPITDFFLGETAPEGVSR